MIKKFLSVIAVLLAVGVAFSSSLSAAGIGKYDSFPGGWNMPFSGTALFYQGYGGRCWSIAGKPPTHVGKDYYAIDLSGGGAYRYSKVYAPASGYVKYADWASSGVAWHYGKQVIVEAGATGETGAKKNNRYIYRVAHLDTITPKAGWWVNKGDVLGTVGNTGNSKGTNGGYHIHFAVHRGSYDSYGLISGDSFPPSWPPGIDGFDNKVACIGGVTSEFQPPLY